MQHHFIDPYFFLDALLEFATEFEWYPLIGYEVDDMGRRVSKFDKQSIVGSLQPQTGSINFRLEGNTHSLKYKFYCMSKYRINLGDFIYYHNRYLHVDEIQEYDEAGVRECSLTMINLTDYRDFESYINYINGTKTV
jgi:hypothetical protein